MISIKAVERSQQTGCWLLYWWPVFYAFDFIPRGLRLSQGWRRSKIKQ